jgi:hypothetical protein
VEVCPAVNAVGHAVLTLGGSARSEMPRQTRELSPILVMA